jgi:hypothetical protein
MAIYALVRNNVVVNVVVADAAWVASQAALYDQVIAYGPDDPRPNVGDQIVPDAPDLDQLKEARYVEIDERTQALIAEGFDYNGHRFSLSANAQQYWNGLGGLVANGLLQPSDFPLYVNGLHDADEPYGISDATDAVMIFATGAATVKARLGSGTTLKNAIRDAATVGEVNAVHDER